MDQTLFTKMVNYVSLPSLPFHLLLLLLLPVIFFIWKQFTSQSINTPPGPKPWPIVGNLPQMSKQGHISMTHFAKIYGPLISLRLGTRLHIIASSPSSAIEILKNHDRLLSARYIPEKLTGSKPKDAELSPASLMWAPECTGHWKLLRTMCRTELFSPKAIESQTSLRASKLAEMVDFVRGREGQAVKIKDVVFTVVFNTLSNLFFSKDLTSFEEDDYGGCKGHFRKLGEVASSVNLAEFFPILAGLDLQDISKKTQMHAKLLTAEWENIVKERKENRGKNSTSQRDFLDAMIENEFADHQINQLVMELFSAGTDTTTITVEWAMAELLKNREAMERVLEELRSVFGDQNSISESNLSQLPYLEACFKETLRLHAPVPFLLPHCAPETCEVMNYTIPKNARILVNVWAIGRDSAFWEDPLLFKPERFIGSELDFKGHNYEYLPFGAGRRICPGLPMGIRQGQLILAYLLHCFDWSFPNGEDASTIDMTEKLSLTLQMVKPLHLIPKWKL
ncbi:probable (S)-N-methylcoclaurine 3'-hydroxylase isozyme 2 [Ziziphus jujuba]|uniref:Probable (S)-N-methylcoclaurine 3'-hydroxylase isozyme 2 n=1 Tax=Ziziphus jujuba TaxID=326968 RepID=A0A6P3ZHA3_ZIZJJ|nr:probable (S)-N-methylcoclaurine 3'-hydroxylase isozyme 2 [Ziziphus jujuba]